MQAGGSNPHQGSHPLVTVDTTHYLINGVSIADVVADICRGFETSWRTIIALLTEVTHHFLENLCSNVAVAKRLSKLHYCHASCILLIVFVA